MGTRQELGLAVLCALLALAAWLGQADSPNPCELPAPCEAPGMLQSPAGPHLSCGRGSPLGAQARLIIGLKLDLNRADSKQLQLIPGIGPARAAKIVELRTRKGGFSSLDELIQVRGIGDKTLEKLRPWLELGGRR